MTDHDGTSSWEAVLAAALQQSYAAEVVRERNVKQFTGLRAVEDVDIVGVLPIVDGQTRATTLLYQVKHNIRQAERAEQQVRKAFLEAILHPYEQPPPSLIPGESRAAELWKSLSLASFGEDSLRLSFTIAEFGVRGARQKADQRLEPFVHALQPLRALGELLAREIKREARPYLVLAQAATDALLRELHLATFDEEPEPPVVESSPCGVAKYRAPVMPRPPTGVEALHPFVRAQFGHSPGVAA